MKFHLNNLVKGVFNFEHNELLKRKSNYQKVSYFLTN